MARDCNFIFVFVVLLLIFLFLHVDEISRVIFMQPAVSGRGGDYSCPLGSLEGAQRDPGWGGGHQKLVEEFFSKLFCRSKCSSVHLLYLLLLRVVLGVLAQVVLQRKLGEILYFIFT